ncbi:RNA polymerase sigma factor RpoH [Benzoatithermus flavus]|uniref:RNA polymerase sigma factor RpoH n=1 Tax=Benzoatithermus flavus TaxID=3108223 RepID=A0ABU8XNR5_9PROT
MKANLVSGHFTDDLGRYLEQARQQPILSAERERELAERWREQRDPEAARELVASHLRLVVKLARGYGGYGFPLAELVAEGNVGLVQALEKFDPERGFRFATYAMWWIKAAIQEHILHNWSLVKLGTTAAQKKLFFNLRRLKAQLGETGGGDLPPEAVASIARDLEVGEGEVVEMNRRLATGDASLNARLTDDSDSEWSDTLVDESQDQEHEIAEASELAWRRGLLADAMEILTPRERHILIERRLKDEPVTLEELARIYGVSRERIRQIEVRAFERVQKAMLAAAANDRGRRALAA